MSDRKAGRRIVAGMTNGMAMALLLSAGLASAQTPAPKQTEVSRGDAPAVTTESNPFLDNATAGFMFRTATFKRWSPGDPPAQSRFNNQAAGIGGWLYGNTGEIANFLSFAGTANFTLPLWAPSGGTTPRGDYNGYNYILKDPYQDGYAVIGEANARLRYENNVAILGYQSINYAWYLPDVYRFYNKLDQAMIGRRDVRAMQPLTYLAATAGGKALNDTLRYWGGYVWDMKQINDDRFRNMYQAAYQTTCWSDAPTPCQKQGDSNGMAFAGVQWKPNNDSMYQVQYYNVQNMLNMGYVDGDWVFRFGERRYFRLGAQWMYQSSSGNSLTTGANGAKGYDFTTNYGGIYLEGRPTDWFIPYGMAGVTASGAQIQSPYSIGPSFLVQRIGENSKASERTWIVGTIFDFGSWGLQGLSFDVSYGQRSNREYDGDDPSAKGGQPLADWNELATDLVYVFPKGSWFQNLRARARYAKVWQEGKQWVGTDAVTGGNVYQNVDTNQQDVRFDLQFVVPFK